ncbi:hypothetical protein [Vibrio sp. V39_P1S14PM300]|uniref:hypothetical protein n=1 Tax=Vibrio sp. V39_P1S14PM300 TaxID=1938690 RepID=UPI001372612A|nr:hypothetical protein [Vibrio sp. V39_P1S14PM300]NAX23791.1 hypothetical protein [Vibrio sp. V39_P1S14PM300]
MAVTRRDPVPHHDYDEENDFTTDQRRRYTQVANTAVKRRQEQDEIPVHKRKRAAVIRRAKRINRSSHKVKYALAMLAILAVGLSVMYLSG